MNVTSIFMAMIQLFLILIVGWAGQKSRVLPESAQTVLTKLVVYITTPCTILYSVLSNDNLPGVGTLAELLILSTLCHLLAAAIAWGAVRLLRVPQGSRGTYMCMLIFSNCGFIGFPVVQAIFGHQAVFYNAVVNIPFYPILYTLGVGLLARDGARRGGAARKLELKWSTFVSPCLVASLLAIVLALTGWKLPQVLTDTVATIGNITTPGALLVIGISIAKQPLRRVLGSPRIYALAALRLVGLPVLLWLGLRWFIADPVVLGVIVVVFAMPTATMVSMLAGEYGGDEEAAVQGVFLTTLLSMVTIPLLMALLM